jgi:hypothetical protein
MTYEKFVKILNKVKSESPKNEWAFYNGKQMVTPDNIGEIYPEVVNLDNKKK